MLEKGRVNRLNAINEIMKQAVQQRGEHSTKHSHLVHSAIEKYFDEERTSLVEQQVILTFLKNHDYFFRKKNTKFQLVHWEERFKLCCANSLTVVWVAELWQEFS